MPHQAAGLRIDPPPSVPRARGARPAATAAPAPPEEPPGVWPRLHGLRVAPKRRLSVTPTQPSVGVFVLPAWYPPPAFIAPTGGPAPVGTFCRRTAVRKEVPSARLLSSPFPQN